MADIYCPKCFALTSDQTNYCRSCKRWNPFNPMQMAIGYFILSIAVGAIVTAIYARIMYLSWSNWQDRFENGNNPHGSYQADEAANWIGAAVFLFSSLLTFLAVRAGRSK